MCVQWIRHQRSSSGIWSVSHCTGRAPTRRRIRPPLRLLGGMDVDGTRRPARDQRAQLVRVGRAQRVRRDAEHGARDGARRRRRASSKRQ